MRRTALLFSTAVLAGAAAFTAPSAGAAPSAAPTATSRAATSQAAAPAALAVSCPISRTANGFIATCSGLDPNQTWTINGVCVTIDSSGFPAYRPASGPYRAGDGTNTATCVYGGMPSSANISWGPVPPAGPVGPIVGYVGKCVDTRTAATGSPVAIWDCTPGLVGQQWKVAVDGTIRTYGKCLDVTNGDTGNATRVRLYDCNGSGAQQWQPRPDGSILNPQSGRCLDDLGYSTTNGNQLGIWDCNGAANQVWQLPI
ncbi:ricin-type beta-trefoil lectin domain protein [Kitasatospora sp. NPDC057965]|uniref:ricin-type beta-trefoil lectin domain protein n=1 Tax=Kitasatospora sp. NPDC057965 TaxID=3346291 RepID=UPI0036DAFE55